MHRFPDDLYIYLYTQWEHGECVSGQDDLIYVMRIYLQAKMLIKAVTVRIFI